MGRCEQTRRPGRHLSSRGEYSLDCYNDEGGGGYEKEAEYKAGMGVEKRARKMTAQENQTRSS